MALIIEDKDVGKYVLSDEERFSLAKRMSWVRGDPGQKPKDMGERTTIKLLRHYRQRPFDMIRDGILKIVSKEGALVRFILNEEQSQVLSLVEADYYALRPVRVMVLKGRQIGMSTLAVAINYCLVITSSHKSAHLVTHRQATNRSLMRMFRNYYKYTPEFLKPGKKGMKSNQQMVEFDDDEFGIVDSRFVADTAESRDKLSLGWTYQFNNFSEKAFWPEQEAIAGALKPTIPRVWPSVVVEESTGDKFNDLFHTEYKQAKEGNRPGWYGIFFPVFTHSEYNKPLDCSLEEFLHEMSEDDKARMVRFKLTPEFMNWYISERADWTSANQETIEVFQRMYPCSEEEAFWGAGMSFFDQTRLDRSFHCAKDQKLVNLRDLPTRVMSYSQGFSGPISAYARCATIKDAMADYRNAAFVDDAMVGKWLVWERPRRFHQYVVSVDVAEGKEKTPGIRSSNDYSVIGVWRYTYEQGRDMASHVLVAQYRDMFTDPVELAREAKAVARIYTDLANGEEPMVIIEKNGPGGACIEQGKRDQMRMYTKEIRGKQGGNVLTTEIGFRSTPGDSEGTRLGILIQANECFRSDQMVIPSLVTIDEMSKFAKNEKGKYEASSGHDDTVIEAALAIECIRRINTHTKPIPLNAMAFDVIRNEERERRFAPPPKINIKDYLSEPELRAYENSQEVANDENPFGF